MYKTETQKRFEYLRGELRKGTMSYGELSELQGLATKIEPGDVELLEAAGVPEEAHLVVDGTNPENGLFEGADDKTIAPFVVFHTERQENIAGPFDTKAEADAHRLEILAGVEPKLDVAKLAAWVEKIDEAH